MGNLSDVQIGSIILNMIENVPSYISGGTLWNIVDNEVYFASNVTGDSISISAIGEIYQPAIINLAASAVLRMMELQGSDASSISLGDFSISKGQGSSSTTIADNLRADGIAKLEALGIDTNYYKAIS
jgi:hypothetical protein